jgi:four helix bundle protein
MFGERGTSLPLSVYKTTSFFPREEIYGLTSQIRRSSISIAANIAEGCGRIGERELARFLSISMGSASELEYLLELSKDSGYLEKTSFDKLN